MVVQHNMQAMNANRMLGITTGRTGKSTEKLSSGYKINRAADNAAGLAISEKMRKQIRGLTQASTNAEDGVSCVQTAEGALAEIQDMLQRMNELCIQAANGTNSITDRQYIQDEIDEMVTEIDRISETTKFNELYLLKGDEEIQGTHSVYTVDYQVQPKKSKLSDAGTATPETVHNYIAGPNLYLVDKALITAAKDTAAPKESNISTDVIKTGDNFTQYLKEDAAGYKAADPEYVAYENVAWDVAANVDAGKAKVELTLFDTETKNLVYIKQGADISKYIDTDDLLTDRYRSVTEHTFAATDIEEVSDKCVLYDADGEEVASMSLHDFYDDNGNYQGGLFTKEDATSADELAKDATTSPMVGDYVTVLVTKVANDLEFDLHVGADGTRENKITTQIRSISSAGIGINKLHSNRIGIVDKTGANAAAAVDVVGAALQRVSEQRSLLGAVQNRLEHTINNLDNVVENTTEAESTIRDTDMAEEMVQYSNNNILLQAGQSMLAQANQSNQGVLSLLQ